ncbi:MAG TPA: hypothetical protein VIJ65_05255 [Acidobacteriaceae bacterium]
METLIPHPRASSQPNIPDKRESHLPDPASIQQVLDDVLASPPFCHTQQCQNLLRYIVKHSLAQEEALLRERVIGAEVFGRRPDYDPGDDPVVRIRAAEVRKRLAQFYQSAAHSPHPADVFIDIPSGSYRASFRWQESARPSPEPPPPAAIQTSSEIVAPPYSIVPAGEALPSFASTQRHQAVPLWRSASAWQLWLAIIILLVAGVSLFFALSGSLQQRTYHEFWKPWTGSSKPVIIAVGSNAVYRLSDRFTDDYAREHNLQAQGMEFFVPFSPDATIKGSDLEPAPNSFVALGDVAAVSTVAAALTQQQQTFQERFPNDISFAELRDDPTVLVGGFNNPMTLELTKFLPLVLRTRTEIDDTRTGRRWLLHASTDSHNTEDYAIITRLVQRNGDAPILSVAGLGQYGTIASSNFICNSSSISQLARQLPKNWAIKNLQVLLHVRVVDFKAVSSDVVAVQTW